MDIVERLRDVAPSSNDGILRGISLEAADEIERLRNIIHAMTTPTSEDFTQEDYEAIYGWGGQDRLY